jgi:hypothetical protein
MSKTKTKAAQKIAVSERALIGRINRKLRDDDEVLKTSRSEAARREYGPYYILNTRMNIIPGYARIDLEELARELECLQPWEELAQ